MSTSVVGDNLVRLLKLVSLKKVEKRNKKR